MDTKLPEINLPVIENHTGIPASDARQIATAYRAEGGYKIAVVERNDFRADITVWKLSSNDIQGQYREVKP